MAISVYTCISGVWPTVFHFNLIWVCNWPESRGTKKKKKEKNSGEAATTVDSGRELDDYNIYERCVIWGICYTFNNMAITNRFLYKYQLFLNFLCLLSLGHFFLFWCCFDVEFHLLSKHFCKWSSLFIIFIYFGHRPIAPIHIDFCIHSRLRQCAYALSTICVFSVFFCFSNTTLRMQLVLFFRCIDQRKKYIYFKSIHMVHFVIYATTSAHDYKCIIHFFVCVFRAAGLPLSLSLFPSLATT